MGYANPSNVVNHEQKFNKSEWTVFIRTKNPTFRPYISQFINFVDFSIPKKERAITVLPPEQHFNNNQESKANYQIMTKLERNKFKLDAENPEINVVITIFFNNELSSK